MLSIIEAAGWPIWTIILASVISLTITLERFYSLRAPLVVPKGLLAQTLQAFYEALNGYTLSDRGTWLSFKNRGDLKILVQGDRRLFNQYGVMLVNSEKHPSVKVAEGQAFVDWLISSEGQATIAGYKINGEQLFFPNAAPTR